MIVQSFPSLSKTCPSPKITRRPRFTTRPTARRLPALTPRRNDVDSVIVAIVSVPASGS